MQPAGILSKRAFPCNRHSKKKGIEAGIVETLAEVASGRDYDTLLDLGNCREPRGYIAALLLALPTAQYDHMPCETLKTLCNDLQVGGTLSYHDRRTARFQRPQDISEYKIITRFIGYHFLENILDGGRRGVQCGLKLKAGIPDPHHVIEWALGGLRSRIYAMADGTTLHNDDRVMPVFSGHRC